MALTTHLKVITRKYASTLHYDFMLWWLMKFSYNYRFTFMPLDVVDDVTSGSFGLVRRMFTT